jgi:hypothetical protein
MQERREGLAGSPLKARPGRVKISLPTTALRCPILTLGPTPSWPGVRREMLKDKSKISRFIHLMGVHLMGVHLMGMHLIGVHLISLYLIPLGSKCDPPLNLWALTGAHLFLMGYSRKAPNHT